MSLTIKIKGGTLQEGESLCRSCRSAHIQLGFRESEEAIFCNYGPLRPVRFKVAECTDYENRTVPYRWELEKMALLINVEPARKRMGFNGAGFAARSEDHAQDEDEDEDDISTME
jgi:hypothetical protein